MEAYYEQYKGLLFRMAYQLTGSVTDAEDIVQDVFVKAHSVNLNSIAEPKAYLCKMVTNRSLDLLKSAAKRREQYFGPWLPEPLPMRNDDPLGIVVHDDMLSYAMLVLLERLSPAERAVFVLREALCFEYSAIAEITQRNEANCRKLLSRARGKMGISGEEEVLASAVEEEWLRSFLHELSQGHVEKVLELLADDAVLVSDGGGKAFAAARPIESKGRVAPFLLGIFHKASQEKNVEMLIEPSLLNCQIGLVIRQNGSVTTVIVPDIKRGLLQNVFIIRNPEKLAHIQHVAEG